MMTAKEFLKYCEEQDKIKSDGNSRYKEKQEAEDLYWKELSDLLERCPVGIPGVGRR